MKEILIGWAFLLMPSLVLSLEPSPALLKMLDDRLRPVVEDVMVVESVRYQNEEHSSLTPEEIARLDKVWRQQISANLRPLIMRVLDTPVSDHLRNHLSASDGLITEIIVMDNRGLNVGVSSVTSDYWQGDEAKWLKTFPLGPQAVHVSDVEYDESTQRYQIQVSLSLVDPDSDSVIGAATFGLDAEKLP
ncbi:MAG: hypothetical protein AAF493_27920 [Pseudomonadota bacterium]